MVTLPIENFYLYRTYLAASSFPFPSSPFHPTSLGRQILKTVRQIKMREKGQSDKRTVGAKTLRKDGEVTHGQALRCWSPPCESEKDALAGLPFRPHRVYRQSLILGSQTGKGHKLHTRYTACWGRVCSDTFLIYSDALVTWNTNPMGQINLTNK